MHLPDPLPIYWSTLVLLIRCYKHVRQYTTFLPVRPVNSSLQTEDLTHFLYQHIIRWFFSVLALPGSNNIMFVRFLPAVKLLFLTSFFFTCTFTRPQLGRSSCTVTGTPSSFPCSMATTNTLRMPCNKDYVFPRNILQLRILIQLNL